MENLLLGHVSRDATIARTLAVCVIVSEARLFFGKCFSLISVQSYPDNYSGFLSHVSRPMRSVLDDECSWKLGDRSGSIFPDS